MRPIDADAVDYENIMCSQEQLHWLNAIIEKQPTIDSVPVVHGRWELVNDYQSRCTACKELSWVDHDAEPNFCPNCGAKMDGGVEDG